MIKPQGLGLRRQVLFTLLSAVALPFLLLLLGLAELFHNRDMLSAATLRQSLPTGVRFDPRIAAIDCLPLVIGTLSLRAMGACCPPRIWLTGQLTLNGALAWSPPP